MNKIIDHIFWADFAIKQSLTDLESNFIDKIKKILFPWYANEKKIKYNYQIGAWRWGRLGWRKGEPDKFKFFILYENTLYIYYIYVSDIFDINLTYKMALVGKIIFKNKNYIFVNYVNKRMFVRNIRQNTDNTMINYSCNLLMGNQTKKISKNMCKNYESDDIIYYTHNNIMDLYKVVIKKADNMIYYWPDVFRHWRPFKYINLWHFFLLFI